MNWLVLVFAVLAAATAFALRRVRRELAAATVRLEGLEDANAARFSCPACGVAYYKYELIPVGRRRGRLEDVCVCPSCAGDPEKIARVVDLVAPAQDAALSSLARSLARAVEIVAARDRKSSGPAAIERAPASLTRFLSTRSETTTPGAREEGETTMKLEVWNDAPKKPETPVRLRLFPKDGGRVSLHVVDEDGGAIDCGCIATIDPDGSIRRFQNVDPEIGFDLDPLGRVRDRSPRVVTELPDSRKVR